MTRVEWLNKISDKISNCKKCDRLRGVTPYPMPNIMYCNVNQVKIMIVGRNPGLENDHSKIKQEEFIRQYHKLWWECKIGRYIRKNFGDSFTKNHVFFTNICKCSSPANAPLSNDEKMNCFDYLCQQNRIVKPEIVIGFGTEANRVIDNLLYGKKVHLLHPSYFLYQSNLSAPLGQEITIKEIMKKYA